MKTIKFLTLITVLTLGLSSCKKAADIDFTTDFNKTQSVHVNQTAGTAVTISESSTIELENDDTREYLEKIQEITVHSFSYKIKNFTGDPAGILSLDIIVNGTTILHNENTIVKEAADNETIFEVTDLNDLNIIATQLLANRNATIEYTGTSLCDGGNMDFDIEIDISATIVANPL